MERGSLRSANASACNVTRRSGGLRWPWFDRAGASICRWPVHRPGPVEDARATAPVALLGADYPGLKLALKVDIGDRVALGQTLFEDKQSPGVHYAFRELSADLAITYLNEKARPHVEPCLRSAPRRHNLPLRSADDLPGIALERGTRDEHCRPGNRQRSADKLSTAIESFAVVRKFDRSHARTYGPMTI